MTCTTPSSLTAIRPGSLTKGSIGSPVPHRTDQWELGSYCGRHNTHRLNLVFGKGGAELESYGWTKAQSASCGAKFRSSGSALLRSADSNAVWCCSARSRG